METDIVESASPSDPSPAHKLHWKLAAAAAVLGLLAASLAYLADKQPRANWLTRPAPAGARLRTGTSFQTNSDSNTADVDYTFPLVNASAQTIDVIRIGHDVAGLRLRTVRPSKPFTLAPGASHSVTLTLHLLSCADVSTADEPLPVEVRYQATTGTMQISLEGGGSAPWQQFATQPICGHT